MKTALPEKAYSSMESKFKDLSAGLGTVLFFENKDTWDKLVHSSPMAAPMVGPWGNVVSGMAQYIGMNFLSATLYCYNLLQAPDLLMVC